MTGCLANIGLAPLIDYLAGELTEAEADTLEAHFFGCEACTHDLGEIARIGHGVVGLVRGGTVPVVMTAAMDAQLVADGVTVREFQIQRGGTTRCGVAAEDALVAVCLNTELVNVQRAVLRMTDEGGLLDVVHEDIPLQRAQGAVRVGYPGALIRTLPDSVVHLVLELEDHSGARRFEEFHLVHSAAGPP